MFLSVDIDVVDPGSRPGTGTPEPGGFSSRQLLDAVRRATMELPVAGIDVVEVSPPYDHAEVTAYLANRVVLEALSGIAWRRRRRVRHSRPPRRGTPARRASAASATRRGQAIVATISSTMARVVPGWRKARRATVSPSHVVGVTNPICWARRRTDQAW